MRGCRICGGSLDHGCILVCRTCLPNSALRSWRLADHETLQARGYLKSTDPHYGAPRRDKIDGGDQVAAYHRLQARNDLRSELACWYASFGYSAEQIADMFTRESLGNCRREVSVRTIRRWAQEPLAHARVLRKVKADLERERKRKIRVQVWHILLCERAGCPSVYMSRRKDSRTCSDACRKAVNRAAVTDKRAVSDTAALSRGDDEQLTTAERDAILARLDVLERRFTQALAGVQFSVAALAARYPDDERVQLAAAPLLGYDGRMAA